MDARTPYVEFFVPGRVASGGSKQGHWNPKAMRKDGQMGKVVMAPDSKYTKPWMAIVGAYARDAMLQQQDNRMILWGPILLWIEFLFVRPKGHFGTGRNADKLKPNAPHFHTSKPDGVKCCRSTEDACTGIIWRDDSQVAMHNLSKVYADPGQTPGASVKVYLLQPVEEM